jgi:hypothetical protein
MIDFSRQRIAAFRQEIALLQQSEFPYKEPSSALDLLEERFKERDEVLVEAKEDGSDEAIYSACADSLKNLKDYLPILGFILRSTNIRNAFEVYAPLLRLARRLLGTETKLIISSEWDLSPFVYHLVPALRNFVLIGLPAPESSNPLLIPLAGHELGHSIWTGRALPDNFRKNISDRILQDLTTTFWDVYQNVYPEYTRQDLLERSPETLGTWAHAHDWALSQSKEMFCDFFGLRLFAESFLHAFAYLTFPGLPGPRDPGYPSTDCRIFHLASAANTKGVEIPDGFEFGYDSETEPAAPWTKSLVAMADAASASIVEKLIDQAWEVADQAEIPKRDPKHVLRIAGEFNSQIAPTIQAETLVDLLNAGWCCRLNKDLWKDVRHVDEADRHRLLGDLLLKNMEVSEFIKRRKKLSRRRKKKS